MNITPQNRLHNPGVFSPSGVPSGIELTTVAGPIDGPPVLIATMHGKERVLGPLLSALGFRVVLPVGYDTDKLGTFSGDVRRPVSAREAALQKAYRVCDVTGIPRAVASEGSYRPCQKQFPGARNVEVLAFVDREAGIEIVECMINAPTSFVKGRVPPNLDAPEVQALLSAMGWPDVRALVVPNDPGHGVIPGLVFKGIGNEADLAAAFSACAAVSDDGWVHLETDLRAHMNPTRMASVSLIGERLALRLRHEGFRMPMAVAA